MELKPGLKLTSTASTAAFIVIRAPAGEVDLTCAGAPLGQDGSGGEQPTPHDEELLVGKRYADPDGTVELLCTHGGAGPLLLAGRPLAAKAAKSLPSSD